MRKKGEKFPTRPLEMEEYKNIIELFQNGFKYTLDGKEKVFRPNMQIALILRLQANVGLRIGDILSLKLSSFKGDKLQIEEDKKVRIKKMLVNGVYSFVKVTFQNYSKVWTLNLTQKN